MKRLDSVKWTPNFPNQGDVKNQSNNFSHYLVNHGRNHSKDQMIVNQITSSLDNEIALLTEKLAMTEAQIFDLTNLNSLKDQEVHSL